ncbi:MAG: ion transporter [Bacteroidales bacterium]|nr:ion transporter [Bacteroidales bacterium]
MDSNLAVSASSGSLWTTLGRWGSNFISALRAARAIRLLLSMRLLGSVKNLRILMASIGKSLPNIGWIFLLLMFFNVIYTVIGTLLFAGDFPELFGRLHLSFYTMIELMTLEGWNDTARVVMTEYPYAWIFFLSYIAITANILLNAVAGVIVDCIMSPGTEESKEREIDMIARQDEMAKNIERLEAKIDELTKRL